MKEVNISAHIPIDLANKLQRVSEFEERSKSYHIKKGLAQILDEKSKDIEDYLSAQKTLAEAKEKGEDFVSFDEVFKDIK